MIQISIPSTQPPSTTILSVTDAGYPHWIRGAPRRILSAEMLATGYRAAYKAGLEDSRQAAAERLLQFDADLADVGFLTSARVVARRLAKKRPDLGAALIFGMILDEIYKVLVTENGAYAEKDWDGFCYQIGLDVSRRERAQKRMANVRDLIPDDHDTREAFGTAFDKNADLLPFEIGLSPEVAKGLWLIVDRTAREAGDDDMALIIRDQFGRYPSKQSGTKWRHPETKKPSLQVQLGWTSTDRDRLRLWRERARKIVRANVLAAIESGELLADASFLRDWHLDSDS